MTDRQKFAIAALLIVSAVLGLGWITAEHWLPVAQAIIVSGGA
jgi:hypothetical protein